MTAHGGDPGLEGWEKEGEEQWADPESEMVFGCQLWVSSYSLSETEQQKTSNVSHFSHLRTPSWSQPTSW